MNGIPLSIRVTDHRDRAAYGVRRPLQLFQRLWMQAGCGYRRYRQRRALAQLDERLLRDIGVTPEQARRESAKPFWQA